MQRQPDAIILSGGFGLRLRGTIGELTPKPMAPIAGRPFLELLLRQLRRHDFSRVILGVGHRYEVIRDHLGDRACGMEIVYSIETSPLGTGGALRQAADFIGTDTVVVMNGDSYTDVDLRTFTRTHSESGADATAVVIPDKRSDAGSVVLDAGGLITAFKEKNPLPGSSYVSAGIYVFNRALLLDIPAGQKISLEEQVFSQWLADRRSFRGFIFEGECLDIGTPERYQKAQSALEKVELEGGLLGERQS